MIARIRIENDGRGNACARLLSPRHRHRRHSGHEGWKVVDQLASEAGQVHTGDVFLLRLNNPFVPTETPAMVVNAEWARETGGALELSVDLGEYDHPATRGAR